MNQLLREIKLAVLEMNQVAATVSVGVKTDGADVRAEVFEVGVDGRKPGSPLAMAASDLTIRIGTPFLWSAASQPCYAVVVSAEKGGVVEQGEVQFGFDSAGRIVVTGTLKKIPPAPSELNPDLPSLFVVGDSTAYSNGANQRGWGDELADFFDPDKINVLNRARPGRSTRSYRNEGLWSRVLAEMKNGDGVLIQFGHNDADPIAEGRCRGVLPGVGGATQSVTLPDGGTETVHTYGWYLRQFIAETRARGATPILLALTAKNLWQDDKFVRHQSDCGDWAKAVTDECSVPFVNLTMKTADCYEALGREKVQPLFCSPSDNVHTSPAGARLNAELIAASLKNMRDRTSRLDFKDASRREAGKRSNRTARA